MYKKYIALAIASIFVVGCSYKSPTLNESIRYEREQQQRVKSSVKASPAWFLSPPVSNQYVVFTSGSSVSTSLSMSRNKAILDAQTQLADQISSVISGMTRQYERDYGVNTVNSMTDTEVVVRKIVSEVDISGYRVEQIEIKPEGRFYRTYVLLAYPIGENNTLREMQINRQAMQRFTQDRDAAFRELDNNLR